MSDERSTRAAEPGRRSEDGARPSRFTRRRFLTGLGVAGATAIAGGYGLRTWRRDDNPSGAESTPVLGSARSDRTLVVLELAGGNDGLSTVVPHATGTYHDLRPTLTVEDPIELDDEIGLHPALATVAERYEAGQVAIVEGVGYPEPDLSHFASMAIWWSGRPEDPGGPGWLGRYLDATVGFDDPLAGMTIGARPSPALLGDRSFSTSIVDSSGLVPAIPGWVGRAEELHGAWESFGSGSSDRSGSAGQVRRSIAAAADAGDRLDALLGGSRPAQAGSPRGRGTSSIPDALELAATLAVADGGPRVIVVEANGDFDTHQNQAARHPALLEAIDEGVRRFVATVEERGGSDRVVLATTSEFGRRPKENGSGTDHGTANPHLVIGAPVTGGRYGEALDLDALDDDGNLAHTVDFRSLSATLLQDWLGAEAAPILGGEHERLGLLNEV